MHYLRGAYMGLTSLVSLAGLGLIIWGKSISPFQMVWQPIYEWRSLLALMLMIPALICVVAGNVPLSYLRKLLRNPMLLGILLWSLSHLWANGDLASILLFGSFALWSTIKLFSMRSVVDVRLESSFLRVGYYLHPGRSGFVYCHRSLSWRTIWSGNWPCSSIF